MKKLFDQNRKSRISLITKCGLPLFGVFQVSLFCLFQYKPEMGNASVFVFRSSSLKIVLLVVLRFPTINELLSLLDIPGISGLLKR